jgi:hypothetical protein
MAAQANSLPILFTKPSDDPSRAKWTGPVRSSFYDTAAVDKRNTGPTFHLAKGQYVRKGSVSAYLSRFLSRVWTLTNDMVLEILQAHYLPGCFDAANCVKDNTQMVGDKPCHNSRNRNIGRPYPVLAQHLTRGNLSIGLMCFASCLTVFRSCAGPKGTC